MLKGLKHVASDPALPDSTTVAIIGGGIVGVTAALTLAEQGIPVCLFEKGEIAAEQSGRNWGWVRKMGRKQADVGLAQLADTIWPTLEARCGEPTGYRVNGSLYPVDTPAQLEEQDRWRREIGDPAGTGSVLLDARQTADLLPGCVRPFIGALHTPSDGCAEPFLAGPAIALGARKRGARVFTNCAVRGLETSGGRVSAVVTEQGRVACDTVLLAGGAWSTLFLRHLGVRLPQLRLRASVCHVEGVEGPDICCSARDVSLRRRLDGTFTFAKRDLNTTHISPDHFRFLADFLPTLKQNHQLIAMRAGLSEFLAEWRNGRPWGDDDPTVFERIRVLGARGEADILDRARASLVKAFPAFEGMTVIQDWSGEIEGTPDGMPVLDRVDRYPGLFVATGFSGHGFGIGPAVGQVMAELMLGQPLSHDLGAFRFDRF